MDHRSRTLRIVSTLALIIALFSACFFQARYDAIQLEHFDIHAPAHKYIMPAPMVRRFAFGFDDALADYYWVTAIQDFLKWDRFDTYYPEYFRIIPDLDPKFEFPYIFALLTVPTGSNPESFTWLSIIAEEGIAAFPENWRIPFCAAMQEHIVGKSNAEALRFLEIANSRPSSPEIVHQTYAIYLMKDATDYKKSRALFTAILETTDNEETKRIITERIALLDVVEALEQAIAGYRSKYGEYPTSVDQLSRKLKLNLPEDLIKKYAPAIDQSTGKILLR